MNNSVLPASASFTAVSATVYFGAVFAGYFSSSSSLLPLEDESSLSDFFLPFGFLSELDPESLLLLL
jgi:hypothetical protein